MSEFEFTAHAYEEMKRRKISVDIVISIVENPEQIVLGYGGRVVYQSRIEIDGKLYIIRVIIEETDPLKVITVYRSSKVRKYWREDDEDHI